MKAHEALIAWNRPDDDGPMAGKVEVGPLIAEDAPDWSVPYRPEAAHQPLERRALHGARP